MIKYQLLKNDFRMEELNWKRPNTKVPARLLCVWNLIVNWQESVESWK